MGTTAPLRPRVYGTAIAICGDVWSRRSVSYRHVNRVGV